MIHKSGIDQTNQINSLFRQNKIKRISGVSDAFRYTIKNIEKDNVIREKDKLSEFTIKIVNTLEEREAVFNLGYQVYLEKGYIQENPNQWLIQEYDNEPSTILLIVKDKNNKIAGSVTLVFKEINTIPAEKIYFEEINGLLKKNRKLVEISRLIIDKNYRNSKEIILLLFNYLSIYAYHIKKFDDLIIQVNPRHKGYYEKLLHFKEIGSEKMCPSVQNAPAVLMSLALQHYQDEIVHLSNENNNIKKDRSLYSSFLKPEQESLVAYYLEKQSKLITQDERIYFGLTNFSQNENVYV